jgi:hypothetical protein
MIFVLIFVLSLMLLILEKNPIVEIEKNNTLMTSDFMKLVMIEI